MQHFIQKLFICSLLLALSACSGLKFVPEGQRLYTGSEVTIVPPAEGEKVHKQAELQTELESVLRPQPNGSFLGMRPKLYFWSLGQKDGKARKKGLGKTIAETFGEAPVLLAEVQKEATRDLMTNRNEQQRLLQRQHYV